MTTMSEDEAVEDGVGEAFAAWLADRPATILETIEDAVEEAVSAWLQGGAGERIVERVAQLIADKANPQRP
jgi:hypothetical protein